MIVLVCNSCGRQFENGLDDREEGDICPNCSESKLIAVTVDDEEHLDAVYEESESES